MNLPFPSSETRYQLENPVSFPEETDSNNSAPLVTPAHAWDRPALCTDPSHWSGIQLQLHRNHPPGYWILGGSSCHALVLFLEAEETVEALSIEDARVVTFAFTPSECSFRWAQKRALDVICVEMSCDLLRDAWRSMNGRAKTPPPTVPLLGFQSYELVALVSLLLREARRQQSAKAAFAEQVGRAIAVAVINALPAEGEHEGKALTCLPRPRLRQVLDYIDQNLNQEISVRDLAERARISPSHFIRLFRHSTGLTPYQYVLQRRLERAKHLIQEGRHSLVDITYELGFPNQSHFTYLFHKYVGVTPKRYSIEYSGTTELGGKERAMGASA